MLNAAIVNLRDNEELALTLNGKKSKIKADDFIKAAATLGLQENVITNLFAKYKALKERFVTRIMESFLADELKDAYIELISRRIEKENSQQEDDNDQSGDDSRTEHNSDGVQD